MQHISATSFARSNTKRQTTKPLTNNPLDFKKTLSQGNIFTPHIIRQTTREQNHLVRLQNSKNPLNSVQTSISSPSFSMVDKGFNQMQLVHEDNEE